MNELPSLMTKRTSDAERKPPIGQVAVVTAGLMLGILLLGIQLWLLTIALDRYLAGQGNETWLLAIISGLVFLGGLLMLRLLARHPHLRERHEG